MNIFCDIDGTLTINGEIKNSEPILSRIEKLRELSISNNVIVWSGNGQFYAENFCEIHNLEHCLVIGKPHLIIDDNPTIRPNWMSLIKTPDYLGDNNE